eukprot:s66_g29.t1
MQILASSLGFSPRATARFAGAMADIHIYFGSQSGTAESFSEDLKEEVEQNGMTAEVHDLQNFTPEGFAETDIAVMVVATYGDGEPSDNAVAFHKWAMNPKHDGALKGQRFTVMGLGDMNYSRFNNMGQLTDLNLDRLGATRIYKRGIGDDSQDIVEDFEKWRNGGLLEKLKEAVEEVKKEGPRAPKTAKTRENGNNGSKESTLPFGTPKLELAKSGAVLPAESFQEPTDVNARFYFEAEKTKIAKVKELRQLRSLDEGLSTMEVEIEASGSLQDYTTAGTLALLPRNSSMDVVAMLQLFGLAEADLSRQLTFKAAEGSGSNTSESELPLREEVKALREELRLLTVRVDRQQDQLNELIEDREFVQSFEPMGFSGTEAVSTSQGEASQSSAYPGGGGCSPLYSWQYRETVAREIGGFLRRSLRGERRGESGRNKLKGLQNKIYVVVCDAKSKVYDHPALVVRTLASVKALCYRNGSWGDCIFVSLPTQREAFIGVAAAGLDWPATIQ